MTPDQGLSEILGPVLVRVEQGGEELSIDLGIGSVTSVTLPIAGASGLEPASITSSHALSIHHMTGDGGALTLAPSDVSAADSTGRHWNVPLPSGSGDVTVLADGPNEVRWSIGTQHRHPPKQHRIGPQCGHGPLRRRCPLPDAHRVIGIEPSPPHRERHGHRGPPWTDAFDRRGRCVPGTASPDAHESRPPPRHQSHRQRGDASLEHRRHHVGCWAT